MAFRTLHQATVSSNYSIYVSINWAEFQWEREKESIASFLPFALYCMCLSAAVAFVLILK